MTKSPLFPHRIDFLTEFCRDYPFRKINKKIDKKQNKTDIRKNGIKKKACTTNWLYDCKVKIRGEMIKNKRKKNGRMTLRICHRILSVYLSTITC